MNNSSKNIKTNANIKKNLKLLINENKLLINENKLLINENINKKINKKNSLNNFKLNSTETLNKDNIIVTAIKFNKPRIINYLIENADLDLNKSDIVYNYLLCASYNGRLEICKLLIDNGADLNIQDKNGLTALMYSITYGNYKICELLIDKGADLNIQNNEGNTALMYSIINKKYKKINEKYKICELLIEKKADLDIQNKDLYTALMMALYIDDCQIKLDICRLLIDNCNVETVYLKDKYKGTALIQHITKMKKESCLNYLFRIIDTEIATLLIDKALINKSYLDIKDIDGNTALILTAYYNLYTICKLLIDKGANIQLRNNKELNVLDCAKNGSEIHTLLLEKFGYKKPTQHIRYVSL